MIALILITGTTLLVPVISQRVIDVGLDQGQAHVLLVSALLLLVIGVVRPGLTYLQRYLTERIATQIGYDLRKGLYDHSQYLPFSYHDHAQAGQLINRCIEDVRTALV